ncbi:MAG: class I SAM-dependent methyltransferase, partial [Acidimicrobiales bacterium]
MRNEGASPSSAFEDPLEAVRAFWDTQACGEVYGGGDLLPLPEQLEAQANARFSLEPYLEPFARFWDGRDQDVLEIGVGMGADHLRWAQQDPKRLVGIDLTPRAIRFTGSRLRQHGLNPELLIGNAELLPFADNTFDIVYSWGVLHHTPNTEKAIGEVYRVLRPGGEARVMIYHRPSVVGMMLWARYGLLAGHPRRTLKEIYA